MSRKKSYVRANLWSIQIEASGLGTSTMTINGQNKNGRHLVIKIEMDEYHFPKMIGDMRNILLKRQEHAINTFNNFKKMVNP